MANVNIEEKAYVDGNGLLFLWGQIKALVRSMLPTKTSDLRNDSNFVSDSSYVHTDNNYSSTDKNKLKGISAGANVNVIEKIKINGVEAVIGADKSVDIRVADEVNLDGMATTEDVKNAMTEITTNINNKVGQPNGLAVLDDAGKIPSDHLPSYVDDVVECVVNTDAKDFSSTWLKDIMTDVVIEPTKGKIYVVVSEGEFLNKEFRWSGTQYTKINDSGSRPMTNDEILSILNS